MFSFDYPASLCFGIALGPNCSQIGWEPGLRGVFLGGANGDAPTAANAPSVSNDYMTQNDSSIQVQEPFYIGDGTPYSNPNVTAQFVVPAHATRLFLGTMDGFQWNNNGGSYTVTITQQPTISLVQ